MKLRKAGIDRFDGDLLLPGYVGCSGDKLIYGANADALVWLTLDDLEKLEQLEESLLAQYYSLWHLVILGSQANVVEFIQRCPQLVNRIQAINPCLSSVESLFSIPEYNAHIFLYSSMVLEDYCFNAFLSELENTQSDIVYSDSGIFNRDFEFSQEFFRIGWSPELVLAKGYIGCFAVSSRLLSSNLAYFFSDCTCDYYSLLLMVRDKDLSVSHIPEILWHGNEKTVTLPLPKKTILSKYLDLVGVRGEVIEKKVNGEFFLDVCFTDQGPSVAVIIPTKDKCNLLRTCLNSLRKSSYERFKIYIIDNDSEELKTKGYLESLTDCTILPISSVNGKFNYARINNEAARIVDEELLLFLNNDTEVISPNWLSQMVGWLQFDGVKSVGAQLLFKNGLIQHAGLVNKLLYNVLPAPAFKLCDPEKDHYMEFIHTPRNCSAVTAACMLTPKDFFFEIGGFDEEGFAVAYNDCDYGFRIAKAGYRNVYCPTALLYHYEGITRGVGVGNDDPAEEALCVQKYGAWQDPYYSENLTKDFFDFSPSSRRKAYYKSKEVTCGFVSHNLNCEGAPIVLYDIVAGLKAQAEINPIVISYDDGPLRADYERLGVPVFVLDADPFFSSKCDASYQNALMAVVDLLKANSVNVVVANTVLSWWAVDAAELAGISSIWCIHESEEPFSHFDVHGAYIKSVAQHCLDKTYQTVFVANSTRKLFELHTGRNNFSVIHNGFNELRMNEKRLNMSSHNILDAKGDEVVFLMVATVCDRKNQIEAIRAFSEIEACNLSKARLIIVGDRPSPYSQQLHELINSLPRSVQEQICVVGETDRVAEYYNIADVLVLCSKLESYPVVIQEAMYWELAIITTPSFGVKEQVVDQVSALFYELGNHLDLANKIERLIDSPEERAFLAKNANVSLAKLRDYESMVNEYYELISEAVVYS